MRHPAPSLQRSLSHPQDGYGLRDKPAVPPPPPAQGAAVPDGYDGPGAQDDETVHADCTLDIDIFVPKAQDPAEPRIQETR